MYKKYYTLEEIQTMKFRELPNTIYNAILRDIENLWGMMTRKLNDILDNANVFQLDQFVNIYKYIIIIGQEDSYGNLLGYC